MASPSNEVDSSQDVDTAVDSTDGIHGNDGVHDNDGVHGTDLSGTDGVGSNDGTNSEVDVPVTPLKSKDRGEEELDFEEEGVEGEERSECVLSEEERVGGEDRSERVLSSGPDAAQKPSRDEPAEELDEGQVNSDDDLEEGELKDDDEPVTGHKERSPCRFFGKGQCTWGDNCRFSHDFTSPNKQSAGNRVPPMGPLPQKIPFEPLPLPPLPIYAHTGLLVPPPPPMPTRPMQESGWERGIKTARERIVRANERKEKDVDFNEKRLNMSVEDDDGYRSSRSGYHYPSRDEYYSSCHDRRSPHGHHGSSSSNLYSKYAEQYYSESSSRSSRYQEAPPRDERYSRDRRERESEYERRQRLALESAPKEWQEGRERHYDAYGRSSGRPDSRRPDDYVDPYRRSPNPRPSSHHDVHRGEFSSFSDTSGSGLSGSSDLSGSDSDSWSDHGEPTERAKKRKDYKKKSYSSSANTTKPAPAPAGGSSNPLSKRIPKLSERNRPQEEVLPPASCHPSRSSHLYDDRREDRYGDGDRHRRHRGAIDAYSRSRSRSQLANSMSPESDRGPVRGSDRRELDRGLVRGSDRRESERELVRESERGLMRESERGLVRESERGPVRGVRDEEDGPYRKKRRSGHQSPQTSPVTKEPSFSMNLKGKSRSSIASKAFNSPDSLDGEDGRTVSSPKDENSLSPSFEQMSPKQQIAHLSAQPDTSQRRKALLEQLRAVEAAIAKKKKS